MTSKLMLELRGKSRSPELREVKARHQQILTKMFAPQENLIAPENPVQKSQQKYDSFVESLNGLVWEFDLSSQQVCFVSQKAEQILGYPIKRWLTEANFWENHIHPDDREWVLKNHQQMIESQQDSQVEYRMIAADGRIVWLQDLTRVVLDREKGIKLGKLMIDISQRQAALEEIEERFQAFMNHNPTATWIADSEGKLIYVNPTCLQILQLPTEAVIGKSLSEVFPGKLTSKPDKNPLWITENNEIIELVESNSPSKDSSRHFLVYKFPISQPEKPTITGGIAVDISEYMKVEKALRKSEARLKAAIQALEDQAEQEQLIMAITNRIRQSLDLQEILDTTVVEVREFIKSNRVIIYQFNPDSRVTVIAESVEKNWMSMLGQVIDDDQFKEIYIQLYKTEGVQAISDIYISELTAKEIDFFAEFQVRANLAVPIVQDNKLWGLLVAQHCKIPRQWQSLEINLLKQLATQVAIAIQQSELYQQAQLEISQRKQVEATLQQKIQREKLLAATAQRIRQSLELDEILNTTVMEVRQLLQADRTVIFRFEPDGHGVVSVESVVTPELSILNTNIYDPCFSKTYIEQYKQGRIRAVEDIYQANLTPCYVNLLSQFKVRSNLVVPILQGEHLWGLLIAHQCTEPRQWQPHETELLEQIATQVGIAIGQSQLYQQLERLATLDGLTQIANRRYFDNYLDQEWKRSQREQYPLSLLLLDVDHFKLYNDTYGHQAGDECLQKVAKAIQQTLKRGGDLVARYGGEEFVILLPNTKADGAIQIAQDIHHAIQQLAIEHSCSSVSQFVTVSIGISTTIPTLNGRFEGLVSRADKALYEAKQQRNTHRLHRLAS
ncbi:diguanylate cyclase domain-containing protein [Capilliphycus salinus ALCB114379]|uniref:diguanylate cyclase domain-containing protein n=1 Tax=Capilliphycus salinus TaxID=2768948 RepID=UPI0039A54E77